jgi:hypothetical protein
MASRAQPASVTRKDVYWFFLLACAITWSLDFPLALAWATHAPPPGYAMPMTGLGALGPTVAAFVLAARRGDLLRALPLPTSTT